MSEEDRQRWDRRYQESADSGDRAATPSRFLLEGLAEWDRGGCSGEVPRALDVACGSGRNSLALAARGFKVDAVDVSEVGLSLARKRWDRLQQAAGPVLQPIRWLQTDLDQGLPGGDRYDLILVIRYLNLALLRALCTRLQPGGLLIAEVYLLGAGSADGGEPTSGPRNRAFLAAPGALLSACSTLDEVIYREGLVSGTGGRREALAQYVGRRVGDD